MKRLFAVVAVLVLFVVSSSILCSQVKVRNRSAVSVNASYGFYSPNDAVRSSWSEEGSFGGLCMTVRTLFRTRMLDSRLSIGGEYGLHTLASVETGGTVTYYYGGMNMGSESAKDYMLAHSLQCVGDYLVTNSPSLDFHFGAGIGIVFFSGEKSQPIMVVPSGDPYAMPVFVTPKEMSSIEFSGSTYVLLAIPIAMNTTIDPELRYFKTLGDRSISIVQIAVGISYEW